MTENTWSTDQQRIVVDFTPDGKAIIAGSVPLEGEFNLHDFFIPTTGMLDPRVRSLTINQDGTGTLAFDFANADIVYEFLGWIADRAALVRARLLYARCREYTNDEGEEVETDGD